MKNKKILLIVFIIAISLFLINIFYKTYKKLQKPINENQIVIPVQKDITVAVDVNVEQSGGLIDSLLKNYIKTTNNPLVVINRKQELYYFDSYQVRDGVNYAVYDVGHTVYEGDGSEPRTVHDAWVFIDLNSHKLYEEDLSTEKLIEFK